MCLNVPIPKDGDLTKWAKSGILLLNYVTTAEEGRKRAHKGLGWEQFTANCIKYISSHKGGRVVFCLWGKETQSAAVFVDKKKHLVLKTSSPSNLTVNQGFSGCGHFIHINQATRIWE